VEHTIRILLVGKQGMIRAALRKLVESWPQFQVAGEAETSTDALPLQRELAPDIILIDVDGDQNSFQLLSQLHAAGQGQIIALMKNSEAGTKLQPVRLGARGVVMKENAVEELRKAIEKVNDGEIWLDRSLLATFITEMLHPDDAKKPQPDSARISSLTERESEIARLVCAGLRNRDIGKRLCISETTVRHHLTSILAKVGVSSRFELTIFLFRNNFAKPPVHLREEGAPIRRIPRVLS
jgi:two-component system, NarL family, nitrate/nitrite response regulator NarL